MNRCSEPLSYPRNSSSGWKRRWGLGVLVHALDVEVDALLHDVRVRQHDAGPELRRPLPELVPAELMAQEFDRGLRRSDLKAHSSGSLGSPSRAGSIIKDAWKGNP